MWGDGVIVEGNENLKVQIILTKKFALFFFQEH